jgi:hypothetical protein
MTRHLTAGSVTLPTLASDITNILSSGVSGDLTHLVNKITNIENYLVALSSTYTVMDENQTEITFSPINECNDTIMTQGMSVATTATVPLPSPEPAPCPPN